MIAVILRSLLTIFLMSDLGALAMPKEPYNALIKAIKEQNVQKVRSLANQEGVLVSKVVNEEGMTLLYFAGKVSENYQHKAEIVTILLEQLNKEGESEKQKALNPKYPESKFYFLTPEQRSPLRSAVWAALWYAYPSSYWEKRKKAAGLTEDKLKEEKNAMFKENKKVVESLLKAGSDPKLQTKFAKEFSGQGVKCDEHYQKQVLSLLNKYKKRKSRPLQ